MEDPDQRGETLVRLRGEVDRLAPAADRRDGGQLRSRILDAARAEAGEKGLNAEATDILKRAGVGASSLYRHFESKEGLFRALLFEMRDRVGIGMETTQAIDDPAEALLCWMRLGFGMLEDYGVLAAQVAGGLIPARYLENLQLDKIYRFTGTILERLNRYGYCEPRLSVRSGVRVWFALVHPVRVYGCLLDGMSLEQVERETLECFLAVYCEDSSRLARRWLEGPTPEAPA